MIANGATSYVDDTSGAAFFAETSTWGTETDWFLGSLGEMKLMYNNLPGLDDFAVGYYWSSSGSSVPNAWTQTFHNGSRTSALSRSHFTCVQCGLFNKLSSVPPAALTGS
jgi:hypothetical protein